MWNYVWKIDHIETSYYRLDLKYGWLFDGAQNEFLIDCKSVICAVNMDSKVIEEDIDVHLCLFGFIKVFYIFHFQIICASFQSPFNWIRFFLNTIHFQVCVHNAISQRSIARSSSLVCSFSLSWSPTSLDCAVLLQDKTKMVRKPINEVSIQNDLFTVIELAKKWSITACREESASSFRLSNLAFFCQRLGHRSAASDCGIKRHWYHYVWYCKLRSTSRGCGS